MNFVNIVKNEILDKPIKEEHCKKAFIAGLMRGSGKLYEVDGEIGLEFRVSDEKSAMIVSSYLYSLYSYEVREMEVSEDYLNKKDRFLINVSGQQAEEILVDLGILINEGDTFAVNFNFYNKIIERNCCLRSFIKGLFYASGSCNVPSDKNRTKTGYHLEIAFSHSQPAMETAHELLKNGVNSKIMKRKDSYVLYIKSVEEIKNFFAFLPVPKAVLKLTDLMINRELSNNSNRQKNCDMANLNKQVEAVFKQIEAIDFIDNKIGLVSLKQNLLLVAIARKENPEDSLSDIADKLAISKSCLNHRLRKIMEIATQLKEKNNV